jgi:hypothetical protein
MLRRRPRRSVYHWVRQPVTVWLLLTFLYLAAAVLSVLLAIAMDTWWPVLITLTSLLAATACALTALDRRT